MSNRKRVFTTAALTACALFGLLHGALRAAVSRPGQSKQPPPIPISCRSSPNTNTRRSTSCSGSTTARNIRESRPASAEEQTPVYLVILTEKDTPASAYYTNSAARAKALKAEGQGRPSHPDRVQGGEGRRAGACRFGVGFRDKHGQPVIWRFIPANSRPSERGCGPHLVGTMPGLHLRFSARGTAAGAGTAVQIGTKVHEAEPWPQISAPPYFVAYRGSYVHGMDSVGAAAGQAAVARRQGAGRAARGRGVDAGRRPRARAPPAHHAEARRRNHYQRKARAGNRCGDPRHERRRDAAGAGAALLRPDQSRQRDAHYLLPRPQPDGERAPRRGDLPARPRARAKRFRRAPSRSKDRRTSSTCGGSRSRPTGRSRAPSAPRST